MKEPEVSNHADISRKDKESMLEQKGVVIWLYGLSGSGKSTLAHTLERHLAADNILSKVLDGDSLRNGICEGLGFTDEDRKENIRRAAETAKLFKDTGIVTIAAFICPRQDLRDMAREIVGEDDFIEVFVKASYETCARRDVKGLYAKAERGEIPNFTGRDSTFEEPGPISSALIVDTERHGIARCVGQIINMAMPKIQQRNHTLGL